MPSRPAWLAATLGFAGLVGYRALAWRRRLRADAQVAPEADSGTDPRADELRRKLAESKEIVAERDEFEAAETTVDEAGLAAGRSQPLAREAAEIGEPAGEVEERRRTVHAEGRATVDTMRTPTPEEEQRPIHDA